MVNRKTHKHMITGAALMVSAGFPMSVHAIPEPTEATPKLQLDLEHNSHASSTQLENHIEFNEHFSAQFAYRHIADAFSHETASPSHTAHMTLKTQIGAQHFAIDIGMFGKQALFTGAFAGGDDRYTAPVSTDQAFSIETLNNLAGIQLHHRSSLTEKWSLTKSILIGRKQDDSEDYTLQDGLDFIFDPDHDINFGPHLREQLQNSFNGLHPEVQEYLSQELATTPDAELQEFVKETIVFLAQITDTLDTRLSREEFTALILYSANEYSDIKPTMVSKLFDILRQGQARSSDYTLLMRTELVRISDSSHFAMGFEGGKIYADDKTNTTEKHAGVYIKGYHQLSSQFAFNYAAQIAGFENYLNLETIDNAIAAGYAAVTWQPENIPELRLHYGEGKSYSALFGEQSHKEIGLQYQFNLEKHLDLTGYAGIAEVETHDIIIPQEQDKYRMNNIGMRLSYNF